jgi:hypothetical protein
MEGIFLATGSKDNSVKIWELVETGASKEECTLRYVETIDSHKGPVLGTYMHHLLHPRRHVCCTGLH